MFQLQRKQNAHWKSARGLTSATSEVRLQLIEDLIQMQNLDVTFEYVESEKNLADPLTRIPLEFMWSVEKLPRTLKVCSNFSLEVEDISDVENESVDWRTSSFIENKKRIFANDALIPFLNEYHNKHHLAVSPMHEKLKSWISADRLLPSIRAVVYGCENCQSSKAGSYQNSDLLTTHGKRARISKNSERISKIPFNKLHVDVVGPYRVINNEFFFYCTCIVDSCTNYSFVKPTRTTPKSSDVINLLQEVISFANKSPLVLVSDGGRNITSLEVTEFLTNMEIVHQVTSKNSSLCNGRVERFNRSLNEFLRCHLTDTAAYFQFENQVRRGARVLNTTPRRGGFSAHDKVFKFQSELDTFKPVELREEYDELCLSKQSSWGLGFKIGTVVLARVFKPGNKLSKRFYEAVVAERVAVRSYRLDGEPGTFNLKDLKPLPRTEYEEPPGKVDAEEDPGSSSISSNDD
jgi:hypothetical protein